MQVIFTSTLREAFERTGLDYPVCEPEPGRLQRFSTNGRAHDLAGWCRLFADQNGAVFGNWRDGSAFTWQREKSGSPPEAAELARIRQHAEDVRKEAEAEREQGYAEAARKAAATWAASAPVSAQNAYLKAKDIVPGIARERNGWLVIPVLDADGQMQSIQTVSPSGEKRFLPGGRIAGGRCWLGVPSQSGPLALCEGYATAASVHAATGWPVCVSFTAGNLKRVAVDVRQRFQRAKLVICGDDDRATPGNPGRDKAAEAARLVNATLVFPRFDTDQGTDFNDLHAQAGLDGVRAQITGVVSPRKYKLAERTADRLFKGEPPPVRWLVQGVFPLGVVSLLASPPNVGKSYCALDLATKVTGPRDHFLPPTAFGALVANHGRAVYVSAEDDQPEIHRRLWSLTGGLMSKRLHVLSLPDVGHFGIIESDPITKDFRPTREWAALVEEIRELSHLKLIILDTLQALTVGDTNTAQATQPLMNEATALASATGACVILIHHVAKGKVSEIRTSWDALEAIRGSGAIIGSARAAYVMWPPSDGGQRICEALGQPYAEGKVAFGVVAKRYGDARRDRSIFVRDTHGMLIDKTDAVLALSTGDDKAMDSELLKLVTHAWEAGHAFAASSAGHNGLHGRRFELPEIFHDKSRVWFETHSGKLLAEGAIKRLSYRGGARLVPAAAQTPIPVSAQEVDTPEGNDTPEEDTPEENDRPEENDLSELEA